MGLNLIKIVHGRCYVIFIFCLFIFNVFELFSLEYKQIDSSEYTTIGDTIKYSFNPVTRGGNSVTDFYVEGLNEVCLGGEKVVLSAFADYDDAKFQWYRNGVVLQGETKSNYVHISGQDTGSYKYYYTISYVDDFGRIVNKKSKEHKVLDIECCTDDDGNFLSRKLIWKNDFGTFEGENLFYIWDYTEVSEPKKVYYNSEKPYRYCLSSVGISLPEGASNCGQIQAISSSGHEVAAYISSNYGSELSWAAMCGNGTRYGEFSPDHYFPDHTDQINGTERYGACLFVNAAGGDYSNDPLLVYKQNISNLCANTDLEVRCFVNTFSDSKNPVRIKIVVYDTENPNLCRAESDLIEKYSDKGSPEWVQVAVKLDRIISRNLTFEIHDYAVNVGDQGDDLLLDDIQVFVCSKPTVESYFNLSSYDKTMIYCEGDNVNLFVDETQKLISYYKENLGYLFQYNILTPDDENFKTSWMNLTEAATSSSIYSSELFSVIEKAKNKNHQTKYPSIYFRVVAGEIDVINNHIASSNYFNPNDPCSLFSISDPIQLSTKCPTCSEPKTPKISAQGGLVIPKETRIGGEIIKHTTVVLKKDESTFFSVNDISGLDMDDNPYSNYTMTWTKNGAIQELLLSETGTQISNIEVKYDSVTTLGTMFIFNVHDNFENGKNPVTYECDKSDTIIVVASPRVFVPDVFCGGNDIDFCLDVTPITTPLYSSNLGFLFQYNTTNAGANDFSNHWENLIPEAIPTQGYKARLKDCMIELAESLSTDSSQLHFRVILGCIDSINLHIAKSNSIDRLGERVSISKPIRLRTKCCYEPKTPQIEVKGGLVVRKGEVLDGDIAQFRTVKLYDGEFLTLSSNDIAGVDIDGFPYIDYSLTWYQEGVEEKRFSNVGTVAPDYIINYEEIPEEGIKVILNVHDNFEDRNDFVTAECDKNDTLMIIKFPRIIIPEFFTPNGDGINDTWIVGNISEFYPNATIQIFDRNGKQLAEMQGYEAEWDGIYNAELQPSTDYWYVVTIREIDRQYVGHFTLIRGSK